MGLYKKGVGTSFAYPDIQALALPLRKDKQRQSAHARMIYRYMNTNNLI